MRHPWENRTARIGLALTLLLFSNLACQTLFGTPQPTPQPALTELLTSFQDAGENVDANFESLDVRIDEEADAVQWAALAKVESEEFPVRFAATYALAETAETAPALQALRDRLQDERVSIRVLAAEALLVWGDPAGIPVLIDSLDDESPLAFAEPPFEAWAYAQRLLTTYTLEDFGLQQAGSFEQVSETQDAWRSWWEEEGDHIVWDESEAIFTGSAP